MGGKSWLILGVMLLVCVCNDVRTVLSSSSNNKSNITKRETNDHPSGSPEYLERLLISQVLQEIFPSEVPPPDEDSSSSPSNLAASGMEIASTPNTSASSFLDVFLVLSGWFLRMLEEGASGSQDKEEQSGAPEDFVAMMQDVLMKFQEFYGQNPSVLLVKTGALDILLDKLGFLQQRLISEASSVGGGSSNVYRLATGRVAVAPSMDDVVVLLVLESGLHLTSLLLDEAFNNTRYNSFRFVSEEAITAFLEARESGECVVYSSDEEMAVCLGEEEMRVRVIEEAIANTYERLAILLTVMYNTRVQFSVEVAPYIDLPVFLVDSVYGMVYRVRATLIGPLIQWVSSARELLGLLDTSQDLIIGINGMYTAFQSLFTAIARSLYEIVDTLISVRMSLGLFREKFSRNLEMTIQELARDRDMDKEIEAYNPPIIAYWIALTRLYAQTRLFRLERYAAEGDVYKLMTILSPQDAMALKEGTTTTTNTTNTTTNSANTTTATTALQDNKKRVDLIMSTIYDLPTLHYLKIGSQPTRIIVMRLSGQGQSEGQGKGVVTSLEEVRRIERGQLLRYRDTNEELVEFCLS